MKHHYGSNFHLVGDTFLQTLLTELCQQQTMQPQINRLVQLLYNGLIVHAANSLFPQKNSNVQTRMKASLESNILNPETKAVSVNLARAGTYPSHICYEYLHWFLKSENIRQDHIFAARKTDDADKVTGTNLSSFKIGGSVENSYVLFPDPMGATGGTIISAIEANCRTSRRIHRTSFNCDSRIP
jgi:uracil phosphoribosyltransferase